MQNQMCKANLLQPPYWFTNWVEMIISLRGPNIPDESELHEEDPEGGGGLQHPGGGGGLPRQAPARLSILSISHLTVLIYNT